MELEGTTLGPYLLQRRLARGGMSEVYLAYDQSTESTQRTVAMKVVNRYQDDHMQRIQNEAKVLGMLSHPHILPGLDYGEQGPWCYFVMPYIEEGSLRERLDDGPLTQEEAGTILEQVASALQYLHDRGILHRDIKPANILFAHKQHVYLTDFGLSGKMDEGNEFTTTGCITGTPEYMAPEMAEEPTSISSDIYALGIVLYQMLTGRVPFKARTPVAVCWKHIQEQPASPSLLNPAISWPVEQVILCALEKDPRRRFPTVQAMIDAYKQAASQYNQALPIAAPTIRLLKVSTQSGRLLRQRIPALPRIPYHATHVGGPILLAALLFLVLPLILGIYLSGNTLKTQALTVSSASIAFAQADNGPHNPPPHLQLTDLTKAPAGAYTSSLGNGSGSKKVQGNGNARRHGHKHKPKPRHKKISTRKED